jgi:hypothetical protein
MSDRTPAAAVLRGPAGPVVPASPPTLAIEEAFGPSEGARTPRDVPFYGFCPGKNSPRPSFNRPSLLVLRRDPTAAAIWDDLDKVDAARRKHDARGEREALADALEQRPHDPVLSLYYGIAAGRTDDLGHAAAALTDYVRAYREDVAMAQLLARIGTQLEIEAGDPMVQSGPISLRCPREVSAADATVVADQIAAALDEAATWTATTPSVELAAVLYRDRSELLASACVPAWSGGLFDGVLRLVWQKDPTTFVRSLRHEVFHAQLSTVADRVPSWFNEGAAQYFSGERVKDTPRLYQLLLSNHTYIPFSSVQGTFQSFDEDGAASIAYRQSLAMVQMLVSRRGSAAITDGVRHLEVGGDPTLLLKTMAGGVDMNEADLLRFLAAELGQ